jgi:hypothetical protein
MTDHGITLPPLPHRALRPGAGDDAMQDYARAAVLLDRQQRDGPHHLVDALQDRAHPAEVLTPSTRSRVVVTTPAPSAEPVQTIIALKSDEQASLSPGAYQVLTSAVRPSAEPNLVADADALLITVHQHLRDALRIPTTPWPDPSAHGHEATGRAVHAAFCALRFKVMDALAALTSARCGVTDMLAASPPDHTALLRQALEALEERYVGALRDNAIDALRAALEPKQC